VSSWQREGVGLDSYSAESKAAFNSVQCPH
jgi:hypothetical protein